MTASFSLDTSQLDRLAVDLGKAGPKAVPAVAAALAETAIAVRDDLRKAASGHARFPAFPQAITHDVRGLSAEIGPDKNRRQGALGNILYFGTAKTGPVLEHPSRALQRQADPFATAVQDAATAALGEALQ